MRTKHVKFGGFTIVELLTVMAVIAVLIGLLIPALALVKDNAKEIQQKAQFHGLDVGLELYKSEFGSYPESDDNSVIPINPDDDNPYCGANKLAEAMVGRDLLGFHPKSDFRSDGMAEMVIAPGPPPTTGDDSVYAAFSGNSVETAADNLKARKGPYVDLENANAFPMDEVYGNSNANFPGTFVDNYSMDTVSGAVNSYPLVLCDVYAKKRSGTNAKKTGTPILYYRARTNFTMQDYQGNVADIEDDIYYYPDNENILELGMPDDGIDYTVIVGGSGDPLEEFQNMIINENVQTVLRPYRAGTYILISAGKDGDFGTADDIFNFEKDIIE